MHDEGLSEFGRKFTGDIGIQSLMDDLGRAMTEDPSLCMLGGGNPAHIPEVQNIFRDIMRGLVDDPAAFADLIGNYDGPAGSTAFRNALADLLSSEYGWDIDAGNIALTLGSQSSFFALFNMFAGAGESGSQRILLPLAPEYIGYSDIGLREDCFVSCRPRVEYFDDGTFKYHVDFDAIEQVENIGAVCVSRPTNPTGNVLTDDEITRLDAFARKRGIPLILDNAYGTPFPGIIFTEAMPHWNHNTIVCMSLSKFGLPATRTGIVIANKDIIRLLSGYNAVSSLSPAGVGARMMKPLLENGEVLRISREIIQPYYRERAQHALHMLQEKLEGLDCLIHRPEGALFLWLWCRGLPISCYELYERLKKRGVLVISGHYFYHGLESPWDQEHECIRITYSQDPAMVEKGLTMIAEEVRRAYSV